MPGISVSYMKGYGEHANVFAKDLMVDSVKIEIFLEKKKTKIVVDAIMDAACCDMKGDGIIAIQPVEDIFRIRTKCKAKSGDLG